VSSFNIHSWHNKEAKLFSFQKEESKEEQVADKAVKMSRRISTRVGQFFKSKPKEEEEAKAIAETK
jgi:hypothetical protein